MKRRATIAEVERLLAAERERVPAPADLAARLKADLAAFRGAREAPPEAEAARADEAPEERFDARLEERLAREAGAAAPPPDLAARLKADLAAHVARTRRTAEGSAAATGRNASAAPERNAAAAPEGNAAAADEAPAAADEEPAAPAVARGGAAAAGETAGGRRAERGRARRAGDRRDSRWSLPLSIAAHAAALALVAAVGWWLIGDQIFEPPTGTVRVASAAAPRLGEEIPGALHADVLPPQGPAFVETARRPAAAVDLHPPLVAFDAALAALSDGRLPRPSDARPEAYVSAFGADLRAPATTPLEAALDAAPSERDPRLLYVRVRLAARDVDPPRRPPASLAVVLDVGGPGAAERIFVAQRALAGIAARLRATDRLSIVAAGERPRALVAGASDRRAVTTALAALAPAASSDVPAAIEAAYDLVRASGPAEARRGVVVVAGGAAEWAASPALRQLAALEAQDGVELSAIDVGGEQDGPLGALAAAGGGTRAVAAGADAARAAVMERMVRAPQDVAENAAATIEFDPRAVVRWRFVGAERSPAAGGRLVPSAPSFPAGSGVAALYAVELADGASPRARLATLTTTFRPRGAAADARLERRLAVGEAAPTWTAAPIRLRLAVLAGELAEALRSGASPERFEDLARRAAFPAPGAEAAARELAALASAAAGAARLRGAAEEAGTWRVEEERPAQPLERPEPAYPEAARRMGIEGDVVLDLSIDAAGRVVDARVARGAPPLAAAALDAAKRWRYRPALVDGRPSPARARATISFRLAR